jgi:glutathione S-transferase
MKLYFSPGACSLAAHISLREIGAEFDLDKVDLRAHKTSTGDDFYEINPKGYVPALETDGGLLTENAAVLPYIADLKPDSGLAPARASAERYKLFEWLGFIGTEVHKSHTPFFSPNATEAEKSSAREKLSRRYDHIEKQLAGKSFLMGERFTVADAYLFVMLIWMSKTGLDSAKWPELKALRQRIGERPAVQAAQQAERAA